VSITALRDGLANRIGTISGLRTASEVPDNVNPPIAIVQLSNVDYFGAMANGMTTYTFTVTVIVGRAAERSAQLKLNGYASSGSGGIRQAIAGDGTLGGVAYDSKVESMTNITAVSLGGDVSYLSADFVVTVYAN